jgi:hypothetical protein
LIECYERQPSDSKEEVFRPRRTLLGLLAAWAKNNASNPRIDSVSLAGQVRIEEILRAFGEARRHVNREQRKPYSGPVSVGNRTGVFNGAESWLRDPTSKLCGRADLISAGEIVDFKSGEQNEDHAEQIVFYGALYLAMSGRTPTALRLVYTATGEVLDVPVPALSELASLLDRLRRRATLTDEQVLAGELPAKPDPLKCSRCHVRGLCAPYWNDLQPLQASQDAPQLPIVDFKPSTAASIDRAAQGAYIRDNVNGLISTLYVSQDVVLEAAEDIRRARFLGVRATVEGTGIRLAFTQFSEIFIMTDRADSANSSPDPPIH